MSRIPVLLRYCGLFVAAVLACSAFAQETFFTCLEQRPPDRIDFMCNWDSLIAPANGDREWDGLVRIIKGDSIQEWQAQLSTRGKYRRMHCHFPPIEINLKKGALRKQHLLEFDKLKVVTHCNATETESEDLMEELLVYKLYNILTPQSFHIIPVSARYLNEDGAPYISDATALIIEPTDELAVRTGSQEREGFNISPDSLDPDSYCRNALFQFMVGNADWSQVLQKNIKLMGQPGRYHVVPYDFDFSAIVMPGYARLVSEHGQADFRDRVYLGQYFDDRLPATIKEFQARKDEILAFVDTFEILSKKRRREIMIYLRDFFFYIKTEGEDMTYGTIQPYKG